MKQSTELDCSSMAPTADTVGAVLTLGLAGLLAYSAATADEGGSMGDVIALFASIPLGIGGVIYAGSAVYGHNAIKRCERFERERADIEEVKANDAEIMRARARAWQLTQEAASSARQGECAKVRAIAARVRKIRVDSYEVLTRDVAIARCLSQASDDPGAPPEDAVPLQSE